jgi:ATP-binding cassette, subfamily B, bacterial
MSTAPQSDTCSGTAHGNHWMCVWFARWRYGRGLPFREFPVSPSSSSSAGLHRGLWLIGRHLRTARRPFAWGAAGTVLWAIALVASAAVLGWVIDEVLLPAAEQGEVPVAAAVGAAALVFGIGLLRAVGVVGRRLGAYVAQYDLQRHDRRLITRRYLALPLTWHRRHATGQLLANASSDIESSTQMAAPLPMVLGATVLLVVTGAFLVVTDPFLALIALLVAPLLGLSNRYFAGRMREVARRAQRSRSKVSEVAHESFEGALVVKTLGRERHEVERFRAESDVLRDDTIGLGRLRGVFDPVMESIPNFAILAVLAVGAWRVDQGVLSAGDLVTFAYLFRLVGLPMRVYGWLLAILPRAVVGFNRIERVLEADEDMPYGSAHLNGHQGAPVHLEDVAYQHPATVHEDLSDADTLASEVEGPEETRGVHEVTFDVAAGRTIAVVGPTGSGKSTIASLLVRLFDPDSGVIRLDGVALDDLARDDLARDAVLVFQDAFLFDDTVRENITLGADVSDDQVLWASRLAQADGFIQALDGGYDTRVGERGGSLSGGQRQRIALARALVRRPRLLVLDDATSAVDPAVEQQILHGMREAGLNTTTIIVAYRRGSIALADEVIFVDHGRVQARGSHEHLLATVPAYADLVRAYERHDAQDLGS